MTNLDALKEKFSGKEYRQKEVLDSLYNDKGLTGVQIAEIFGVHNTTIYKYMEKNDLERDRTVDYAYFLTRKTGYERWYSTYREELNEVSVHRLLAVAKYGYEALSGKEVHHINGVKWDNRPDNIELLKHDEHMRKHIIGEGNEMAILTREEAKDIKKLAEKGEMTQDEIGERFGVSQATVSDIKNGRRWASLSDT